MSRLYIGIDPGLDGAAVAVTDFGEILAVLDTPTLAVGKGKRVHDEQAMANWLIAWGCDLDGPARVAIEAVHAMPKQGVASTFTFGMGYGLWRGLLVGLGLSYDLVTPQKWKAAMMHGQPKEKDASRVVALRLWPQSADCFRLKKHAGRADAALLAEYRRRQEPATGIPELRSVQEHQQRTAAPAGVEGE